MKRAKSRPNKNLQNQDEENKMIIKINKTGIE